MKKEQEYIHYSADDFVNDQSFQDWVMGTDDKMLQLFWEDFLRNNPAKKEEVEQAVAILKAIPFGSELSKNEPSDEQARAAFARASKILGFKGTKGKGKVVHLRQRWWIAAAVLLVIAGGYMFVQNTGRDANTVVQKQKAPSGDILPGGNRAVLTLADGSTIILDSASNGAITKQGSVTVIKLDDGQLAYNPSSTNSHGEQPSPVSYNTITTPRGGQYQLALTDGTRVWLNAESSLTYPTAFNGNERVVKLTGEGYFEVKHEAAKPFKVDVGGVEVDVLGTHFNINAYRDEDDVKTTLLQGSVLIKDGQKSALLKPGEQGVKTRTGLEVEKNVDIEEVMAWKNGLFQFHNSDISTVMQEICRWYNVEVSYPRGIPKDKYWGSIRRDQNLSQVLKVLKESGAEFKVEGRKIIVSPTK